MFTKHPLLAELLIALVLLLAISVPVLSWGYGGDPDAWSVARSSQSIWESGRYTSSRLPGYPLHELLNAPLVGMGGCVASNAGTLLITVALALVWRRIAVREGRHPRWLFFSLALAPLVLPNASVTMDYLWSLLCVVAAVDAALRKRALVAGVLAGCAAGFRPSNLSMALPLMAILWTQGTSKRPLFVFAVTTAVTFLTAFLPVLITSGGPIDWLIATSIQMSDVHPAFGDRIIDFSYRLVYALGPGAFMTGGFILIRRKTVVADRLRQRDPILVAASVAIPVALLQLFLLPLDRAYLLPLIPFLLLALDRVASGKEMVMLAFMIVSLNILNPDLVVHMGKKSIPGLNIHDGRILESWKERKERMDLERLRGLRDREISRSFR